MLHPNNKCVICGKPTKINGKDAEIIYSPEMDKLRDKLYSPNETVLEPAVEKRLNMLGKIITDGKTVATISCTREEVEQFLATELSSLEARVRKEERDNALYIAKIFIISQMVGSQKSLFIPESQYKKYLSMNFKEELLNK